jgi:biotin carboxyl carrier protein
MEQIKLVRVEHDRDGMPRLLAPAVGWWLDPPHAGAVIGPGSSLGTLRTLNRRMELVLPDGAAGRVEGVPRDRSVAVQYGEQMCRLIPLRASDQQALEREHLESGHSAEAGLPPGTRAIVAPTDGVFYRRPSPDAPPFVEVGSRIRAGQPVGLVEVMKTFNQILYGGPGLPEEVEVADVRCTDAQEVQAGEILIVVR